MLECSSVFKMPKTSKRKEKRRDLKSNYLAGTARKCYAQRADLRGSLNEDGEQAGPSRPGANGAQSDGPETSVCPKCKPILSWYTDTFKGLIHQGTELKKRKHANPHPKRPDTVHYRDIKRQNDWMRQNLFDPMGNYLYCSSCICISLKVSKQRLARQRAVKRKQSQEPLRSMTKAEVEEDDVSDYVVMPANLDIAFKEWWMSLQHTDSVDVRYPHARHGNAGRRSNSSKASIMYNFLDFVDANSQPNGRSADSSGPTYYFLPKFSTLQTPPSNCPHYQDRLRRSVVGEFNRAQRESGRGECSNGSCHNWLKTHRPKHGICPHQEDYCDTCAQKNEEIRARQTTLNRLKQATASLPEDLEKIEEELRGIRQSLENHRKDAAESHHYYTDIIKKSATKWKRIVELEGKSDLDKNECDELAVLHKSFNLVIAADYQMSKLVPHWGKSPQPGSTYFLPRRNKS